MNQREMPWLQEVGEPELLPEYMIKACKCFGDAVILCIQQSRYTNETIAERIGCGAPKLTKITKGSAGIKRNEMDLLELACGNRAVTQFMAMNSGMRLVRTTKDERIRELEEQLARERAA